MEGELFKLAMSQGIWTVLSIFLIVYILKVQERRDLRQEQREKNYITLINELTDKMDIINKIDNSIEKIEEKIN
ncbi:hypothetical protein BH721_14515 [Clostridium baratii]|uniref:UviB-like protein n=2 Tax=Clostridium baratii TaxID=1561 RepID=A0A0A7FZG9_9CLOT|nr:BhlA/UviB family holin-like peptide [Clostridium baratii]AGR53834.1 UviB-like protein [Clostridium baratii]AIY85029.1 hypothetical protein U729_695 [Clostridium baratii str. Sullivan]OPF52044.1 hypothetical protein A1M12_14435 [Clostridium baratii]OPF54671.1 hypothetical protein BH721_14515 [Clostridium baratii]OPF54685.1 hypothetical protein BH724_14070 [Clostridium baratii]